MLADELQKVARKAAETPGVKGAAVIALTEDGRVVVAHQGMTRYFGASPTSRPTDHELWNAAAWFDDQMVAATEDQED